MVLVYRNTHKYLSNSSVQLFVATRYTLLAAVNRLLLYVCALLAATINQTNTYQEKYIYICMHISILLDEGQHHAKHAAAPLTRLAHTRRRCAQWSANASFSFLFTAIRTIVRRENTLTDCKSILRLVHWPSSICKTPFIPYVAICSTTDNVHEPNPKKKVKVIFVIYRSIVIIKRSDDSKKNYRHVEIA